ncbi:hypothetical protein [Xanthomonas sp. GW]|uniref:hypothetical protein n=1 Tax=Xanthomonas sp. GW TaxID=2724121 RepID=UPI00163A690C|nr:hypothetical protein [Xanthomonas sp. GW]
MKKAFVGLSVAVLLLAGCTSYQVVPTTNSAPGARSGQVDILYSTPQRPFQSVGMVSAKKYKPGFTDPTISDALEQLRAAGSQVRADAVIVRHTQANDGRRLITVEGEAIRYTDIATAGSMEAVGNAAAAKGFASARGCEAPVSLGESSGAMLYQAKCAAGSTLIIECRGETCNARN